MDAVSIADLLHEAAETHHRVYRITDGADPDWASWYADWLIEHSELPQPGPADVEGDAVPGEKRGVRTPPKRNLFVDESFSSATDDAK